jgi:Uma2 family endonuclease
MPDRQLRDLTPPSTAAQGPRRWRAVGELGQWLSVRNNVSRRIGQSTRTVGGRSQPRERPSPRPDMFCP